MIRSTRGGSIIANLLILLISGALLLTVVAGALLLTLPDVRMLEKCFTTSMFKVRVCPGTDNYVTLKNVSPYMIHALIAAEDGSFYSHKGFDWHEIQASLDLRSGEVRRGASTLTQQLAKNAFLSKDKTLIRKLKEAYLAYSIENVYKKDFILEKYLNMVEFGPNLYGIKAAARTYFDKSPSELHPLEAVWLAHLLPNPKVYSQGFRKGELSDFSKKMVQIILKRMKAYRKLSEPAYDTAVAAIADFPWVGYSISSFEGIPSYSLDTDVDAQVKEELEVDRDSLNQLLEESKAVQEEAEQFEDDFQEE